MGTYERFDLALERIGNDNWSLFENLCSQFLVSEYSDLRTTASPEGDGGRDSELFSPIDDSAVVFQYSVSVDWISKIHKTIKRLKETYPHIQVLIYMSNQEIGSKADNIKRDLRKNSITLDVRDKMWFLERCNTDENRRIAAESLSEKLVNPLLIEKNIIKSAGKAFDSDELRSVYLMMSFQLADQHDKGLTKVAFEAIVRSVLRETNTEKRLSRRKIKDEVLKILRSHPPKQIEQLVDSALKRMTKSIVRHWQQEDEFCLTYEEIQRLSENIARYDKNDKALSSEIRELIKLEISEGVQNRESIIDDISKIVSEIIEQYLSSRGEYFAAAVAKGGEPRLAIDDLKTIINKRINDQPKHLRKISTYELLLGVICGLFQFPSEHTRSLLRMVSDSYTLMAFLKETPDVQKCVRKIFNSADIWLDTTIILPLFAELLIEDESKRQYSAMIHAARVAGVNLFVIPGVLEEINGHLRRCVACARSLSHWEGSTPFLYSLYIRSGRDRNSFPSWIETFRGEIHPEEDIADYLNEIMGIKKQSLEAEVGKISENLRYAVQEVWRESHNQRRNHKGYTIDEMTVDKLIRHDEESYVGLLGRRTDQDRNDVGYSSWWLTLDSTAYKMQRDIQSRTTERIEHSPVMSLDYLSNNLSFGPLREKQAGKNLALPIFLDRNFSFNVPPELIALAEQVRNECSGLPEHVRQRRVRDRLDEERKRVGPLTSGGTMRMQETIESAFEDI